MDYALFPKTENKKLRRRRKRITKRKIKIDPFNESSFQSTNSHISSIPPPNRNPNLNTSYKEKKAFPVQSKQHVIRTKAAKCYYSNHCKYSKELLDEIKRFNIESSQISLICIDKNRNIIPKIVTSVPTIVDHLGSGLYIGEKAFEFVTNIVKGSTVNVMAVNAGVAANFSETFVTLDKDGFSNEASLNSGNFSDINHSTFKINTINENDKMSNNNNNDLSRKMDDLLKSMTEDLKNLKISQ